MLLIPAIDLKEGKCVRLKQGRMEDTTVFSDDPVAVAGRWVEAGAQRLHIVDLNGAFAGRPVNGEVIQRIARTFPDLPIQLGGGIRDANIVDAYLNAGVRYVIIGTKAVTDPHFVEDLCLGYPGHILVGLDARDGKLAVEGWAKTSRHNAIEVAQMAERHGVEAIIYTDIGRDGMLQGVNVEMTVQLARAITIPVIASGGVRTQADIEALHAVKDEGICGVIIGRALYEGTIDLKATQAWIDAAP